MENINQKHYYKIPTDPTGIVVSLKYGDVSIINNKGRHISKEDFVNSLFLSTIELTESGRYLYRLRDVDRKLISFGFGVPDGGNILLDVTEYVLD